MALSYWDDVLTKVADKSASAVRNELNQKIHFVDVSTRAIETFITEYLTRAFQEGLEGEMTVFTPTEQKSLIDNHKVLAQKLFDDIKTSAKQHKAGTLALVNDFMTIRCDGGYNTWASIRKTPMDNFVKRLKALGIKIQDKVKIKDFDSNKAITGTKERFIKDGLQFSHKSPTVAVEQYKEIFDNLRHKVMGSINYGKNSATAFKDYNTALISSALETKLGDLFKLELDMEITMEDYKAQRKAHDTYIVRGEFVDAKINNPTIRKLVDDRPRISQKIKDIVKTELAKYISGKDLEGSPKMSERAADAIIDRFRKNIKSKNITVKSEKLKKVPKKRTTKKVQAKTSRRNPKKLKAGKNIETLAGVGVGLRKQVSKENTRRSNIALAGLMQRLNAALPYMLQRHMVPPKLQYRGLGNPRSGTGPFTSTARVTSLTPMNKEDPDNSGVNVNYTYGLFPYQTFEPGFAQGSYYRDPRKLIEESLMELMRNIKAEAFMKGVSFRRTATGADYKFKRRGK